MEVRRWVSLTVGMASCIVVASLAALFFHASSFRNILPFLFLAFILIVALRFGIAAGFFGTMTPALIFATFLFDPIPNWAVSDATAKDRLIWMVMIGIVISGLLGHQRMPHPGQGETEHKRK